MIVAGSGSREGIGADALVASVRRAAELAAREPVLLAAPWFRDGPAVRDAARRLRLPLRIVSRAEILDAEERCRTHSERARSAHGVSSVAEGCALAAADAAAVLLLPRISAGGVTCAVAGAADVGIRSCRCTSSAPVPGPRPC